MTESGDPTAEGAWPAGDLRSLAEQAAREPALEAQEEERLVRLAAAGERGARDRLFRAYSGLALRLAEARSGRGLSLNDLLQEASLGLMTVLNEQVENAARSGRLAVEVESGVSRQLDQALEEEAQAERDQRQLIDDAEAYQRAEIEIGKSRGREATEAELAEKLEWSVSRTRRLGEMVKDARRRHDEEIVRYLDADTEVDGGEADGEAEANGGQDKKRGGTQSRGDGPLDG